MIKLLVIVLVIKLYAHINIYRHGQNTIKDISLFEKFKTKYVKLKAGISLIRH